jgi:tetratricopeptide (TPR) repeat protein
MIQIDIYLSQAIDAYPYDLKETIESLDYALSFDENNTAALCLYGRIYSEQLPRYEQAKHYFQQAIALDMQAFEVYPYFIQTLLWNEDYDEALKLIQYALTIKGINKLDIFSKKAQYFELHNDYKMVKSILTEMELLAVHNGFADFIEETRKRVAQKENLKKEAKGSKVKKVNKVKKK